MKDRIRAIRRILKGQETFYGMELKDPQEPGSRPNNSTLPLCTNCGFNHRYQFPTDLNEHEPSYVACVNTLIGAMSEVEEQRDEAERALEIFKSALWQIFKLSGADTSGWDDMNQFSLEKLTSDAISGVRELRRDYDEVGKE